MTGSDIVTLVPPRLELGIWVEPDGLIRYFRGSSLEISNPNKIRTYWPDPNWPTAHPG